MVEIKMIIMNLSDTIISTVLAETLSATIIPVPIKINVTIFEETGFISTPVKDIIDTVSIEPTITPAGTPKLEIKKPPIEAAHKIKKVLAQDFKSLCTDIDLILSVFT